MLVDNWVNIGQERQKHDSVDGKEIVPGCHSGIMEVMLETACVCGHASTELENSITSVTLSSFESHHNTQH
jgi:hypothetical protein